MPHEDKIIITEGPSREDLFDALRLGKDLKSIRIVYQVDGGKTTERSVMVRSIAFSIQTGHDWVISGWFSGHDGVNCRFEYNTQTGTGKFLPLC